MSLLENIQWSCKFLQKSLELQKIKWFWIIANSRLLCGCWFCNNADSIFMKVKYAYVRTLLMKCLSFLRYTCVFTSFTHSSFWYGAWENIGNEKQIHQSRIDWIEVVMSPTESPQKWWMALDAWAFKAFLREIEKENWLWCWNLVA